MILYKKVGRKYIPIQEHVDMAGWSKGDYLVRVMPGVTSMTKMKVNPDYPAALVALQRSKEAMIEAVQEASLATPNRKMNPRQQEARDEFVRVCKGMTFTRASAVEIVEAAMRAVKEML